MNASFQQLLLPVRCSWGPPMPTENVQVAVVRLVRLSVALPRKSSSDKTCQSPQIEKDSVRDWFDPELQGFRHDGRLNLQCKNHHLRQGVRAELQRCTSTLASPTNMRRGQAWHVPHEFLKGLESRCSSNGMWIPMTGMTSSQRRL